MTHDSTTNGRRKRRDRPFPWRCMHCLKEEIYPATIPYAADVKHDGRMHHIEIPELTIPKCQACGEVVFNYDADDQIMAALRAHLNLLTPEQIKAGRKALGLKSKELARRLGVADATVSRWEKKMMIQSRAMDNLLRAYFAVPELRAVLRGPDQDVSLGTAAIPHAATKTAAAEKCARNATRSMKVPILVAHGRSVRTPFGLLGATENALTFALGYTFQQCPHLLARFLRDVGILGLRSESLRQARIHLQRTSSAAGREITDIEVHVPGRAHIIVEAKIGLSVPTLDQCVQYLPRFKEIGEDRRRLVALVESPATTFVEQYPAQQPDLRDVLIDYQWARLIPHCIRIQAELSATSEPGRWVRAFRAFLEDEYMMKCFTEEVWIVPAKKKPLWPGGWSLYDTHVRGRIYHHNKFGHKRPLYIALRTEGRVETIQRVLRVEHDAMPITFIPELANMKEAWPRIPETIWHLSEPVQLPKPIPTGDAAMRARHVSCDLDILLSSATIREAADKMRKRKEGLEGRASTVPGQRNPVTKPAESLEEKFRRLAAVWTTETAYVSSTSDLVAHPAFQEIVGMGPAVIPLLLRELEKRTGHWHRALRRITGVDPVPPADRGNLAKTAEAWLRWGKEQGYQW